MGLLNCCSSRNRPTQDQMDNQLLKPEINTAADKKVEGDKIDAAEAKQAANVDIPSKISAHDSLKKAFKNLDGIASATDFEFKQSTKT